MRIFSCLLTLAFLSGCVSQPSTPKEKADTTAVMGMPLMASAAQEKNSATSALWQISIPPAALEVVVSVQAQRKSLGKWPKREEVKLPDGVSEIVLTEGDVDVDLAVKSPTAVLLRCTLSPDGTVTISPPLDQLIGILQSAARK